MPSCIWCGKPSLVPYLLLNQGLFIMTIVLVAVMAYFRFERFLPNYLLAVVLVLNWAKGIIRFIRTEYFITHEGITVKNNATYCSMKWQDLEAGQYKVFNNVIEIIFGCRTVQFAKFYGYSVSKGSNTNVLSNVGRLWCIRDYREVCRLIEENTGFDSVN